MREEAAPRGSPSLWAQEPQEGQVAPVRLQSSARSPWAQALCTAQLDAPGGSQAGLGAEPVWGGTPSAQHPCSVPTGPVGGARACGWGLRVELASGTVTPSGLCFPSSRHTPQPSAEQRGRGGGMQGSCLLSQGVSDGSVPPASLPRTPPIQPVQGCLPQGHQRGQGAGQGRAGSGASGTVHFLPPGAPPRAELGAPARGRLLGTALSTVRRARPGALCSARSLLLPWPLGDLGARVGRRLLGDFTVTG